MTYPAFATDAQYQEAARLAGRVDEITALLVERDRYREALERISRRGWTHNGVELAGEARRALAGPVSNTPQDQAVNDQREGR